MGLVTPPTPFPATLAASGTYNSGFIPALDENSFSASVESTQAGTLTLQRYMDSALTIPVGAAVTQAIVANTIETVSVHDGVACLGFQVSVSNSGGTTATLSKGAIVSQHI